MTLSQTQCLLHYLGYYTGPIDGIWGPVSCAACSAFQSAWGSIAVDGLSGPETAQALKEAVLEGFSPSTTPIPSQSGTFWDRIRYWEREEFRCRCGSYHEPYCSGFPAEPDQTLVELAEDIRGHFGRPAHATSGLRCPQHNLDSGGVRNSAHLRGKALDFYINGVSGELLRAYAARDPRCRYTYVIDGSCVHVEVA